MRSTELHIFDSFLGWKNWLYLPFPMHLVCPFTQQKGIV
jgi:hypothetical protein